MSNIQDRANTAQEVESSFPTNLLQQINAEVLRDFFQGFFLDKLPMLADLNTLGLGDDDDNSTTDIIVRFEIGNSNFAAIKYNRTSNQLEFSNDGVTFQPFGGVSALQDGSVVFFDGGELAENNDNFFWDAVNERFGVGTNTLTSKVKFKGSQDIVQFILQGNVSQTADIYQVQNDAEDVLEAIDSDGNKHYKSSGAKPTPRAEGFALYGEDYKDEAGKSSPRMVTEDDRTIDLRFASEEPLIVELQSFSNNRNIELVEGARVEILDIVYDEIKVGSFLIGAITHGVNELNPARYEPIINTSISKVTAIADFNAWLAGSNSINGQVYNSPAEDEPCTIQLASAVFNNNYDNAQFRVLYTLR